MIRLDKFLCDSGIGSRSEVKQGIKKGICTVNSVICKKPETKVDENTDDIRYAGNPVSFKKYVYLLMNKPAGVISATKDYLDQTVLDLCPEYSAWNLFPVGRLDKDTEGLLLLTNDGALSHELLSPKKHVIKTYEVTIAHPLSSAEIIHLERGVDIGDDKLTMPAKVVVISDHIIHLSIMEGRFHQVKRMLEAVDNKVLFLKRIRMGNLYLDDSLKTGTYKELTEEEVLGLQNKMPVLKNIEAIIFDVDGSLVDSMWMWKQIDLEYLAGKRIELPDDLQSCIEGMSFVETAIYFKERFQLQDSIERIMNTWNEMAWDKYAHQVPLKNGVKEFLQLCKEKKIKMGIATSNSRELMTTIEQVHGLTEYISSIKTGSEVKAGKPAPDIYLEAAKDLEVSPRNCLVFEDILAGIKAGKAAGMKVCAVMDAYSMDQDQEKHQLADYYIEDYCQLVERLTLQK